MARYSSGKETTDDYRQLDIRYLRRKGLLSAGHFYTLHWSRNGEVIASVGARTELDRVILSYSYRTEGRDWEKEEYSVQIEWTPCNYGGHWAWFRCPANGCGRRAAVLYCVGIFACRHCCQLVYESQREAPHSRALRRARAIRERLGGSTAVLGPFPSRPKGMHWFTYERLVRKADDAQDRSWPPWLLRKIIRRRA